MKNMHLADNLPRHRTAWGITVLLHLSLTATPLNGLADTRETPRLQTLRLSPSISVGWPEKMGLHSHPISSFRAVRLEGQSASILIRRSNASLPPNDFIVGNFWKGQLLQLQQAREASVDRGCRKSGVLLFECDRLATNSSGKFVAERLIWNAQRDLVAIRVTSNQSSEHAREVLNQFEIQR